MYLASNMRPLVDKQLEALAQAVAKASRDSGVYATENVLGYAVAKLLTRVCKIKGTSLPAAIGALEIVKQEFFRKVAVSTFDKDRNAYGDVFSEMM